MLKVNLSLVWVVLVLIFTYKLLLSLNGLYFEVTLTPYNPNFCPLKQVNFLNSVNPKGEEAGGERSLVLVMGGAYLLFAMMVII